MLEGMSDQELVKQLQKGKDGAYEILVSRYSDKVFSLASRMTRNQEDAEEVLQDVFVTVYRKIAGFEGKSSFSSWLYRVTVNASLMKLRKRKQDQSVAMEDILPNEESSMVLRSNEDDDVDQIRGRKEILEQIHQAIQKLPEEYRPVFILRDIDGLTSREVGKILGLTVPAVKSRLHRSRLMLRKKLAPFYQEFMTGNGRMHLGSAGNM